MTPLVLALALVAGDAPVERVRTVVLDLEARGGVDPALARAASEAVATIFAEDRARSVLRPADLTGVLKLEAERQLLGCSTNDCVAKIVEMARADRLVHGAVTRLSARSLLISLAEVDASTLTPRARGEDVTTLDTDAFMNGIRRLARDVATRRPASDALAGALDVDSIPPGLFVEIDGRPVGATPLAVPDVAEGTHRLVMRRVDGPPLETSVEVIAGLTTSVDFDVGKTILPTTDALDEYQRDVAIGTALHEGKRACCLGGSLVAIPVITLGSLTIYEGLFDPQYNTDAGYCIMGSVIGCIGVGALLPSLGIGAWSFADGLEERDPPRPVLLPSRVTITPPTGHGQRTTRELEGGQGY